MKLTIREACPQDAEMIRAYRAKIGAETDNMGYGAGEFYLDREGQKQAIESSIQQDNSVIYVGLVDNQMKAYGSISGESRPRYRHRAELVISVLKDSWHQGFATAMMEKLLAFADNNPVLEIIELGVREDNLRAQALYKHFGFKPWGTYENFFKIGDTYAGSIMMKRRCK